MDALSLAASRFYEERARPDGRSLADFADVAVECTQQKQKKQGSWSRASSTVRHGNTVVSATASLRLVHLHPYASPAAAHHLRVYQQDPHQDHDKSPEPSALADRVLDALELAEVLDWQGQLTMCRPSGAHSLDMVDAGQSAICHWIWRIHVHFYVVKADGCLFSAALLSALLAMANLNIPSQINFASDYVCDHTAALADELEFDLQQKANQASSSSLVSIVNPPSSSSRSSRQPVTIAVSQAGESVHQVADTPLRLQAWPFAVCFALIGQRPSRHLKANGDKNNTNSGNGAVLVRDPSAVEESLCCSTACVVCSSSELFHIATSGCGLSAAAVGWDDAAAHSNKSGTVLLDLVKIAQERARTLAASKQLQSFVPA